MFYKYMKKLKKDKPLLVKKKSVSSYYQDYHELDNLLVQFFIVYDELNKPNVLMNFKGFEDNEHCKEFIERFKETRNYNDIDLTNETIH